MQPTIAVQNSSQNDAKRQISKIFSCELEYITAHNWVWKYIYIVRPDSCGLCEPVRYLFGTQSALNLRAGWSLEELPSQLFARHLDSRKWKSVFEIWLLLFVTKDMEWTLLLWKWLWWTPFPNLGSKCVFYFSSLSSTFSPPPLLSVLTAAPATRTFSMSPASEASWRWRLLCS